MKRILATAALAAFVALGVSATTATPAKADVSFGVTVGSGYYDPYYRYGWYDPGYYHRGYYRPYRGYHRHHRWHKRHHGWRGDRHHRRHGRHHRRHRH